MFDKEICDHLFPQVRRPHPLAADDHLLDDGRHWNLRQYPRLPRHPQVIFPVFRKSVFDMTFSLSQERLDENVDQLFLVQSRGG